MATNFKAGVKTLNAQFWLLMASAEHLQALSNQLAPLQGSLVGLPGRQKPHRHESVIGTALFGARRWGSKVRLRNHLFADDLRAISKDCENWLPGYFLVLVKSLAEGHLIDSLEARVSSDGRTAALLDTFRKHRKKRPSRKKAVEGVMQATVRGAFDDLDEVIPLSSIRARLDALKTDLGKYATARNQLAHRLAPSKSPTITTSIFEVYVDRLTELVELLSTVL